MAGAEEGFAPLQADSTPRMAAGESAEAGLRRLHSPEGDGQLVGGGGGLQAGEAPKAWRKVWGDDDSPRVQKAFSLDSLLARTIGAGDFSA